MHAIARAFCVISTRDASAAPLIASLSARLAASRDLYRVESSGANCALLAWDFIDELRPEPGASRIRVVIGDDSERDDFDIGAPLGNAAQVTIDADSGVVKIIPSMTALPPVFLRQIGGVSYASSSLQTLAVASGGSLEIDGLAAVELLQVGFPLNWRTLFRSVTVAPAGQEIFVGDGEIRFGKLWSLESNTDSALSLESTVDGQIDRFHAATRRLSVSNSVLSLTGGLDTRAILSELVHLNMQVPAVTLSGSGSLSLDARIASRLTAHMGSGTKSSALVTNFLASFLNMRSGRHFYPVACPVSIKLTRSIFRKESRLSVLAGSAATWAIRWAG